MKHFSAADECLITVINIYIQDIPLEKVPLFEWKSGTLLIEKRYFSS